MNTESRINIKSPKELQILRDGGKILSEIVSEIRCSLKTGISTQEVDILTENLIRKNHVVPAFKGYRGYPGCICVSINEEVVHGIPSQRIVQGGDLVSIDIGIIYQDYYADMALTLGMGEIDSEKQKLLDVTHQSLYKGIEQAQVDNHLSDISHAIQQYVEANGFSVVREFVGHGIGHNLHEEPEIANYGDPHQGPVLKEGMVFCLEPMVNVGSWETIILDDGWTVVTKDNSLSSHFEHMIAITPQGPEILTA